MNVRAIEESFDDIVVGSSPLMLMQAIYLAQQGRKVALVDRTLDLGGSWQTAILGGGEHVEIACHLIEVFPRVYDILERFSGTRFVTLDAQPIRVTQGGKIIPYFNRTLMLASGSRLVLGWCKTRIEAFSGRANRNAMLNFDTKLKSFLRYQLPTFFQKSEMQAPENGFVHFMERLIERAEQKNVTLLTYDVQRLKLGTDHKWFVIDNDRALIAQHVHLTTCTNLRKTGKGQFEATPPTYANRTAVVVDIPRGNVLTSQSYVAFWKDPAIARISRIDSMGAADRPLRFLIEFHEGRFEANKGWEAAVVDRLTKAQILKDPADYKVIGHVNCAHTTNVDQLPPGKIDDGVWGYYSYGNLAAGIAAWNKQKKYSVV